MDARPPSDGGVSSAGRLVPPSVVPPKVPFGPWRGALVLARNPVEWWPDRLYEGGSLSFARNGRRFLVVTDPAAAETVLLSGADRFCRSFLTTLTLGPALRQGLLTADGDLWRTQRRIASPAFRHHNLVALVPVMAQAAEVAARRLAARPGRVDMMAEMVRTTFDIILAAVFGARAPGLDRDRAARDVDIYLSTVGNPDLLDLLGVLPWLPRPWKWRGLAAAARMRKAASEALAGLRRSGGQDGSLASLLVAARDPETGAPLDDDRIVDNLLTFLAAGHETTALALTWTLMILSRSQAWQERLRAESAAIVGDRPVEAADLEHLDLHRRVVMEAMRLYPPAPLIVRGVAAPVEVGGTALTANDHVSVAVYPMHRNRQVWEDADAFDPDRFLPERSAGRHRFAWIPFGGGPHVCIGLAFAMMEAVTVLATVVRAVRLLPDPAHPVRPVMRVTLRPAGGMPLTIAPLTAAGGVNR